MKTHRNALTVLATTMLAAALPAHAQLLGGGAGGGAGNNAASGALNGGALSPGGDTALEKSIGNRTLTGSGGATGNADAKPGQVNAGANGNGAVSVKKSESTPAPAATPAQ